MKKRIMVLSGLCICLTIVIILIGVLGFQKDNSDNYVGDRETYLIETEYCNLEYPSKWENQITVNKEKLNGTIIEFYIDDVHLFDICFDNEDAYPIGKIKIKEQFIEIGVNSYDIQEDEFTEEEYEELCMMQEDLNVILTKLVEDYSMEIY